MNIIIRGLSQRNTIYYDKMICNVICIECDYNADSSKFWDFFKRKVCEVSAGWSIRDRVYEISDGDRARMIDTACSQSTCRDDLHDTRHDAMITLRSFLKRIFPSRYIFFICVKVKLNYSFEVLILLQLISLDININLSKP